jgi:formylglycine-generating enzyme required for sulfatase activity
MTEPINATVNGHEFCMIPIQGGTFMMGSQEGDEDAPQHLVRVSDFYIGKYPVTQGLWKAVTEGRNPSTFQGDDRPVENVSWDDAQDFIEVLNILTESTRPEGYDYRLPTEAEWEYAARGGNLSEGYKYLGSNDLNEVGWFWENSGDKPLCGEWDVDKIIKNNCRAHPVGLKKPNELGLYDMSGNVWEWVEDNWHDNYNGAPDDGKAWIDSPNRGDNRVHRGGSWGGDARACRAANRSDDCPGSRHCSIGFRLALSLPSVG